MPGSRIYKTTRILIIFVLIVLLMGGTGLWLASTLKGSNPQLKEGLERFFSEASGSYASIGDLKDFSVFPLVKMDIADLTLKKEAEEEVEARKAKKAKKAKAEPWLEAGRIMVLLRFWDVFLSRGNVLDLEVVDLNVDQGVLGPGELNLKKAEILTEEGNPFFKATGAYGSVPVIIKAPLESFNDDRFGNIYRLPKTFHHELTLGPAKITGEYVPAYISEKGREIRGVRMSLDDMEVLHGDMGLEVQAEDQNTLYGHLISGETVADLSLLLPKNESGRIGGSMSFPVMKVEDFVESGRAGMLLGFLQCLKKTWNFDLEKMEKASFQLSITRLEYQGADLGALEASIEVDREKVSFELEDASEKKKVALDAVVFAINELDAQACRDYTSAMTVTEQ